MFEGGKEGEGAVVTICSDARRKFKFNGFLMKKKSCMCPANLPGPVRDLVEGGPPDLIIIQRMFGALYQYTLVIMLVDSSL